MTPASAPGPDPEVDITAATDESDHVTGDGEDQADVQTPAEAKQED